MKNSKPTTGLKTKWKKILRGTPTKEQLEQYINDLQKAQQATSRLAY